MKAPSTRLFQVSCILLRVIIWCLGQRHQVIGRANLPLQGGYVLAPKHRSNSDPPLIDLAIRRPVYFMAKLELFEKRLVAWYFGQIGVFSVDRDDDESKLSAIKLAIRLAKGGNVAGIFPEGERYPSDDLGDLHDGPVIVARRARVPVLPVAIAYNMKFPKLTRRGLRSVVVIGPPVADSDGITHGKGCKITTEDLSVALALVTEEAARLAART